MGTSQSISITGRNGYGEWGGRVTAMTLVGSAQNVSLTGDAIRRRRRAEVRLVHHQHHPRRTCRGHGGHARRNGLLGAGPTAASPTSAEPSFEGSADSLALVRPVVGMAATPDGHGYWLVASDGGIFSYGDAGFYGSTGNIHLNQPVVGMAATPDGHGYWLVAADGGIFSFGDAGFYGSTGNIHLNQPVVGMAATPDGHGYWLVASDGGVFSFGDAGFYGSTGNIHLNQPVVGMASTPDGHGYWLVASDGGIFTFGDAPLLRIDRHHLTLAKPVVGMAGRVPGYWLVATGGGSPTAVPPSTALRRDAVGSVGYQADRGQSSVHTACRTTDGHSRPVRRDHSA